MYSIPAVLLALAAASPYYKLDNMMNSFMAYEYEVSYSPKTGQQCAEKSGYIKIPFHPDVSVRKHQCFAKCSDDPSADGCESYDPTKDTSGSNALCLDASA